MLDWSITDTATYAIKGAIIVFTLWLTLYLLPLLILNKMFNFRALWKNFINLLGTLSHQKVPDWSITDMATFGLKGAITVSTLWLSLHLLPLVFYDRMLNFMVVWNNFINLQGVQVISKCQIGQLQIRQLSH